MKRALSIPSLLLGALCASAQTPYSEGADDPANPHDPPVPMFVGPAGSGYNLPGNSPNPRFVAWASSVVNYSPAPGVSPDWSNPAMALGPATGDHFDIVSLGELMAAQLDANATPGSITLGFNRPIANGPGDDFAVFENGFWNQPELAFVEVSSDGNTFARFPSIYLSPPPSPPPPETGWAYYYQDVRGIFNLAGKHVNNDNDSWGTPFDLAALVDAPAVKDGRVDLMNIRFVRVVDIPGRGDFKDSLGSPIFDSWPTWGSGGFDLEAVGVIHQREVLRTEARPEGKIRLWCLSSVNRVYQLQGAPAVPVTGTWVDRGVPVTGTGGNIEWILPAPSVREVYQLKIESLPGAEP